jgi:hypothetical protein
VFLDAGAELNLIRRDVASSMGLRGPKTQLKLSVAGGTTTDKTDEETVTLRLRSLQGNFVTPAFQATTIKNVASDLRAVPLNPSNFRHLKGVRFTES